MEASPHSSWLQGHCRVCGGRLSRFKVSYDCSTHHQKLLAIGLITTSDDSSIHPSRFCHSCYNTCTHTIKTKESGKDYTPELTKFEWVVHSDINCPMCELLGNIKRGRKPKKTSGGRPSGQLLQQRKVTTISAGPNSQRNAVS